MLIVVIVVVVMVVVVVIVLYLPLLSFPLFGFLGRAWGRGEEVKRFREGCVEV